MLVDAGWQGASGLKALSGGEPLPLDLARRLAPRVAELWNLYGPTETTVWSTLARILPDALSVPIGLPIANTEIVVLDARMRAVPPGVPGELFIGGAGLALGYLGQPDLTEDRFIAHPGDSTARLYRTGDLARWVKGADGGYVLDCLGRADNQIKLRGYRIEPEEIEARLEALPELRQAAVVLREDVAGDQRLVAYLVPRGAARPEAATLILTLAADLPRYMIPSRFVWCDALPLTPNGKTDRMHLSRQPLADSQDSSPRGTWPATQAERDLHEIWQRVLNLPTVGVEDRLFRTGRAFPAGGQTFRPDQAQVWRRPANFDTVCQPDNPRPGPQRAGLGRNGCQRRFFRCAGRCAVGYHNRHSSRSRQCGAARCSLWAALAAM